MMGSDNKRLDDTRLSAASLTKLTADDSMTERRYYHGTEGQLSLEQGRSVESFDLIAPSPRGLLDARTEQMMQRCAQIDRTGRVENGAMINEQSLLSNASRLSSEQTRITDLLASTRPRMEDNINIGFNLLNGTGQWDSRNLNQRSQEFERQVQQSLQRVKRQEQLVGALLREKLERARKKAREESTIRSGPQDGEGLGFDSRFPDAFARAGFSGFGDDGYSTIANHTSSSLFSGTALQQPLRRFHPAHDNTAALASLDSPDLLSMERQSFHMLNNNPRGGPSNHYPNMDTLAVAGHGIHTARGGIHHDKGLKARPVKKKQQNAKKQKSSQSQGAPVYQQMIRKTLEFFEVQPNQVELFSNIQGRRKNIIAGQVGIRCRHCAHHPPHRRGRGAVYFPGNVSAVYQSAQNMAINHFLDCCADMPPSVREQIAEARTKQQASRERKGGGTTFWINLCKSLGLEDRGDGHGLWCPGGMPVSGVLNM